MNDESQNPDGSGVATARRSDSSFIVHHSSFRGWLALVALTFRRHWRTRSLGWVTLGLLGLMAAVVAVITHGPVAWRLENRTTWITDTVIRHYTAGQTADLSGSIDAFERMSKSKEPASLGARLHHFTGPVRLLVGAVEHPAEIPDEQRELLLERLTDFAADTVPGSGQFIHEEQPHVVVDAVAELHREAGE